MPYLSLYNLHRLINERRWEWLRHPGAPDRLYLRNPRGLTFTLHTAAQPAPRALLIDRATIPQHARD